MSVFYFMITCTHCGAADNFRIEIKKMTGKDGNDYEHHSAFCNTCDKFIKNIAHQPQRFYIGKYKGQLVADISDLNYLLWFLRETKPKPAMRDAVTARIEQIEFGGR